MLRLVTDEDFNKRVLAGLLARRPDLDIVRMQDVGLRGAADPDVLAWAAREGRIVLTHDVATMPNHAYERIASGDALPGLFVVPQTLTIGDAIEELILLIECSLDDEWVDQVYYVWV